MSNYRKELVQAARAAGDTEYAAWIESKRVMTFADIRVRRAYYGI